MRTSGTTGPVVRISSMLEPATKGSGVTGMPKRARARWPASSTVSVWPLLSVSQSAPRRVQHTKVPAVCSAPIRPSWAVAV